MFSNHVQHAAATFLYTNAHKKFERELSKRFLRLVMVLLISMFTQSNFLPSEIVDSCFPKINKIVIKQSKIP